MDVESCEQGNAESIVQQSLSSGHDDSSTLSTAARCVNAAEVSTTVDNEALRKALWELFTGSMEAGCEALLSELGAVSSKMSTTASFAETEREVTKFMNAVSPQLTRQFEGLINYFKLCLVPTCSSATKLDSNPSLNRDEQQQREAQQTQELSKLIKTLSSTNRTIEQLTKMHQKTKDQLNTLTELWNRVPPNLTSSLIEWKGTLEAAKKNLDESTFLINELHPAAAAPTHTFEYSAFSDSAIAASSPEHDHQTTSSTLVPSHEHDPLLFFAPAAATVFKAASTEGLDEQTAAICDLLME